MNVLVVGATGVLGQEAVKAIRAAGHRVRAMTHRSEALQGLQALGVEAIAGDLIDAPTLATACRDMDAVLAAAHGAIGRGRYRSEAVDDAGHRALIDAARKAGVSRFLYTSALGASPDHCVDFFRTKWRIERYLGDSGLRHVVLRPSALMEWHAHTFIGKPMLDRKKAVILGTGTKLRNFVAARDVAAVAVRALSQEVGFESAIAIGGPANFTNDDVARLYARTAGFEPRITHVPRAVLMTLSRVIAPMHPGIARVLRISALPDDAFDETFEMSERDPSLPATTLADFVQERVAQWREKSLRDRSVAD